MKEKPTKLKVWWAASVAAALVFLVLAYFTSTSAALIGGVLIYGVTLYGGYRQRHRP